MPIRTTDDAYRVTLQHPTRMTGWPAKVILGTTTGHGSADVGWAGDHGRNQEAASPGEEGWSRCAVVNASSLANSIKNEVGNLVSPRKIQLQQGSSCHGDA